MKNITEVIAAGTEVQLVCRSCDLDGRRYGACVERGTVVEVDPDFGDFIIRRTGEPFNVRIRRERITAILG